MADKKQLRLLYKSVRYWNRWRDQHPEIQPDLSGANLRRAPSIVATIKRMDFKNGGDLIALIVRLVITFIGMEFGGAYTKGILINANLCEVDLSGADLSGTDLRGADLSGANLINIKYNSDTRWPEGFTPPPSR